MVLEKKTSARVEAGQRRVLDEATRQRRLSRQLDALEKDNFQPIYREFCCVQRRKRGRRGATTSNCVSGKTSQRSWRKRTCRRSWSQITSLRWSPPPRFLRDTFAVCADSHPTTLALPVGGATAPASA
ncbi:zinc finger HIT domain-containing protein 1 isoform X2 [Nerophis lumbriciformis]|uniref:zinc finger HIT domain-containing protein 1 isoform X2 n=1 Tax=Nerophis lumbriciformis TaxID=546530 RepID=UPI002ADFED80|nr:uncharacterized protein LOC133606467 isoform X2 [Nerophis lumbriciformis]